MSNRIELSITRGFPFAEAHDPRRSILERYPYAAAYVEAIKAAARQLVGEGLMLEEDVERIVAAAADWVARAMTCA